MLIATEPPQTAIDGALTIPQAIRACYEGRLKQEELSDRTGIPQQTISRLASGSSSPKLRHLVAIEEACDRPRGWILIQAGYIAEVRTVEEAIAVAPELEDGERRILMDVYLGFTNPQS
jgi:transcriptional regulator with XRE-family HTH domain